MVRSKPRRGNPFRILLALALLAAFAGLIVLLGVRYAQVGEVRVPEVTGENVRDASRTLQSLGFEVSTYPDSTRSAPPDSVTSQTPAAGASVRRGRGVALGVSTAGETSVPRLVGLSRSDAEAALESAGLELSRLAYRNAPQPEGTVLSQQPAGGETLQTTNKAVQFTLSLGPQARRVLLPRVVGKRLDVAQEQLGKLGFRQIVTVPTRLGQTGVTAQTPKAGVRASVSAPVTLYYTVANRQVVPVPSVRGLDLERAAERLQAAGLRVGQVTTDPFDPAKPRGVSTVQPDTYTLWGTAVELHTNGDAGTYRTQAPALPPLRTGTGPREGRAGQGQGQGQTSGQTGAGNTGAGQSPALSLPATGGRVISIDYDPANYSFLQGRAYEFKVEVTDDEGTRVALERSVGPDEAVDDTVTVYGETELRMYIDGQIVLAYNPPNP